MAIRSSAKSVLWSWGYASILCLILVSGRFVSLFGQTPNPVPLINQPLVPLAAAPGGLGFTLTVNGTGFVSGAEVEWDGSTRTTTFVSTSQLTAAIFASDIATAGTASVTVRNPSPGGGISNVMFFEISSPTTSVTFSSFVQTLSFTASGNTITGDFNGDGKLDLAGFTGDSVWIALGNGDGTFQTPATFTTGQSGLFLLAADFNNDGKADLAVSNTTNNTVSILLGNGDGTFQNPKTFTAGPGGVVAADFNGDGKLDLVLPFGNKISVFLGNGDGTFQPGIISLTPDIFFSGAIVGDFNRDGKLDLAVLEGSAGGIAAAIYLGNGDGTFQTTAIVSTTSFPGPFVGLFPAADLNGDGKLDLIFEHNQPTQSCNARTAVLLGNGDGTFPSGSDRSGDSLLVADFNADGKLDIIFGTNCASLGILLGNGDGTFQSSPLTILGPGQVGGPVVGGDFNGDGKMDFASVSNNSINVFLQGQWTIAASQSSLTLAPQVIGMTSSSQSVTLTNTGTNTVMLSGIGITGSNAGDFAQSNSCGITLGVGATCRINVTSTPQAAGARVAALTIADNAVGSPQTVALAGSGQDFSLASIPSTTLAVTRGQTANFGLTVVPGGGFNKTVSFSCSGAPSQSTCTVLPNSIVLDGTTAATVTVAISTTAQSLLLPDPGSIPTVTYGYRPVFLILGLLALMAGLAGRRGDRRPRFAYGLALLLLLCAGITMVGCNGGGGSKGTQPGSYALTVSGTFTSGSTVLAHNLNLTLVVQ
jgi:hypothetical protein